MKHLIFPLILLSALLVFSACSDDSTTPPAGGGTTAEGTLTPEGPGFEIEIEFAAGSDSLHRGPFLLKGTRPLWASRWAAFVVDFTITNLGEVDQFKPVSLEFIRLIPETTELLVDFDVDSKYLFEFENDDYLWTPGEESLPKRILYRGQSGQSVGFNAQIGVGGHLEPWIGGYVWLDANRDGVMQSHEQGIPDIPVVVDDGGPQEILHQVITDQNGWFVFRDLEAATYEVRVLMAPAGHESTTPSNMHVMLTWPMGGSDGFNEANFGFAPAKPRD